MLKCVYCNEYVSKFDSLDHIKEKHPELLKQVNEAMEDFNRQVKERNQNYK